LPGHLGVYGINPMTVRDYDIVHEGSVI